MRVDNAIIMAAGTSSRFAPLSYEMPKALIEVKGEVLIERQICQLREAGIEEIIVVTGYKAEQFAYLEEKFNVKLVHNPDYLTRNNNASIYVVKNYLGNSYICSSDNYFNNNPFSDDVNESYYASVYVPGKTNEWCIVEKDGWISDVKIGGVAAWIMLGHVFWSEAFSKKFIAILEEEYDKQETTDKLWETIYIEHIQELPMQLRKYDSDFIFEFDTLDELREFDQSYKKNTRSEILKRLALSFNVGEEKICNIKAYKDSNNAAAGFTFQIDKRYKYAYETQLVEEI